MIGRALFAIFIFTFKKFNLIFIFCRLNELQWINENIKHIKYIAYQSSIGKISLELKHLVNDDKFYERIQKEIAKFVESQNFLKTVLISSLAEGVHSWMTTESHLGHYSSWLKATNIIMGDTDRISYQLNPLYRGELLSKKDKDFVDSQLITMLPVEEIAGYLDYRDHSGKFNMEGLVKIQAQPGTYWKYFI